MLANANALGDAVTAGKARQLDALDEKWKALATEVPSSMDAGSARRLAALEHQKPLPHGINYAASFRVSRPGWTAPRALGRRPRPTIPPETSRTRSMLQTAEAKTLEIRKALE